LDSYLEADVRTAETLNLNIGKFVMNDQRQQISHSSNVVATQAGRDAKLRIDRSFSNAQGSSVRKEMLAQLFELKRLIEQAIDAGQVPEPMALARDFDDFAREASSDGPRRSKLEATAEFIEKGLARAGSIAESAAKTVKAVLDL